MNLSIAIVILCAVYIESRFMPQSTEIDREIIKCIIELNLYAFFFNKSFKVILINFYKEQFLKNLSLWAI